MPVNGRDLVARVISDECRVRVTREISDTLVRVARVRTEVSWRDGLEETGSVGVEMGETVNRGDEGEAVRVTGSDEESWETVDLEDVRVEGGDGDTLLVKVRLELEDDERVLELLVLLEDVREVVDEVDVEHDEESCIMQVEDVELTDVDELDDELELVVQLEP
ncbi:hypothetical protein FRC00_007253 [Tulasnella sp. 408]|nr:hypothetical protein FRC00_007253 [Tulasnella sp. 408]